MEVIHINSMATSKPNSGEIKKDLVLEKPMPDSELLECEFADALANDSKGEVAEMGRKMNSTLWGNLGVIKSVVKDQWKRFIHGGGDSERTKVYQVWPGKNVFFFGGRLVCGPDPRGLLLSTVSIILSSWIFSFYGGDGSPSRSSLIITLAMILTVTVLANLILVATTNPGIIPRNDQESVEEVGTSKRIKRKTVMVNGVELKVKYCKICNIFRPPRSCHCAICDNCVDRYDHHCPWIGQCIGLRNYRFYLSCICSALVFFSYVFALSCWRIHWKIVKVGTGFVWIARNCPETLLLASFSFAAIVFLSGLTIFHLYLLAINQTAYEKFRQRYAGSKNPYDKGKIGNMKEVLFVPLPPSRVDFRAQVIPSLFTSNEGDT